MTESPMLVERSDALRLYAQADLVLLAARLLAAPEVAVSLADLVELEPEALAELVSAAGLDGDPALQRALEAAAAAARETDPAAWLGERTRLFDAGVACPINETAYVRRDKGAILADIAAFQRAFALEQAPDTGEKLDHVQSELELVGLLLVLLARATEAGEAEHALVTREALARFAEDHIGAWIGGFCLRLADTAALPYYLRAADALLGVWTALASAHGLTPAPKKPLLLAEEPDGTPYECDMAAEGVA